MKRHWESISRVHFAKKPLHNIFRRVGGGTDCSPSKIVYCKNLINLSTLSPFKDYAEGNKTQIKTLRNDSILKKIAQFGREKRWRDVLELLKSAELAKEKVCSECIGQAMYVMGKAGRPKEALQLLRHLEKMAKNSVNVQYINHTIQAYATAGDWVGAEKQLLAMQLKGYQPTPITYGIVLSSFVNRGPIDLAVKMLEKIKSAGFMPNTIHYSILINACAKRGDSQTVRILLQSMENAGISPNLISFNSALDACSKAADWQYALELFTKMDQYSILRDTISWNRLIDALCNGNQPSLAHEKFAEMKNEGIFPNATTFNCLMHSAMKRSNINESEMLFSEMKRIGVVPDVFIYSTMINSYAIDGNLEKASKMFHEMLSIDITPNAVTYTAMIKACISAKNFPFALQWFKNLLNSKIETDLQAWNFITNAAHLSRNFKMVDELYRNALSSKVVNPYNIKGYRAPGYGSTIDLHGLNTGMALAAIRHALDELRSSYDKRPLAIITGQGIKGGNALLRDEATKMLKDMGIKFYFENGNLGMIVVPTRQFK